MIEAELLVAFLAEQGDVEDAVRHIDAAPGGFEDLDKLEARLIGALDVDVGQPGGPITHLDRRLKLQPCPVPAVIDPPGRPPVFFMSAIMESIWRL